MAHDVAGRDTPAGGRRIASVCVFCGSSAGSKPEYGAAAAGLGREIGRRGLGLVYGGGNIGSMGVLARSALEAGAHVTGIIPRRLYDLVEHVDLDELIVAETMHERKAGMNERADAFVAMPGGIGTFDELFEAWTLRQLGFHDKPVGLLNTLGFYDPLVLFLRRVANEGFLREFMLDDLLVDEDPGRLLDRLESAPPIREPKLAERHR